MKKKSKRDGPGFPGPYFLLVIFLVFLLFLLPVTSHAWPAQVVSVTDGDTIKVISDGQQLKIRLYGIDTPEKKQAFGQRARTFTADLVAGKMIDVEHINTDRYGRIVGIVRIGKKCLNEELIEAGYSWVYSQYCRQQPLCNTWSQLEALARTNRRGLWQDNHPTPPWQWRRKH